MDHFVYPIGLSALSTAFSYRLPGMGLYHFRKLKQLRVLHLWSPRPELPRRQRQPGGSGALWGAETHISWLSDKQHQIDGQFTLAEGQKLLSSASICYVTWRCTNQDWTSVIHASDAYMLRAFPRVASYDAARVPSKGTQGFWIIFSEQGKKLK